MENLMKFQKIYIIKYVILLLIYPFEDYLQQDEIYANLDIYKLEETKVELKYLII